MFGLQPWHLLVIVVVALILFAPKRFPGAGRALVKAWREFRHALTGKVAEPVPRAVPDKPPWVIFLSSVMRDMVEERAAAKRAIDKLPSLSHSWTFEEDSYAADKPVEEEYLTEVAKCDVFLLVLGEEITPPVRKEFESASNYGKPRLVFLKRCERTPAAQAFVEEIHNELVYAEFDTLDQLEKQILKAIGGLIHDSELFRKDLTEAQITAVTTMLASLEAVEHARPFLENIASASEPSASVTVSEPRKQISTPEPPRIEKSDSLFTPQSKYGNDGKRMILIPAGEFLRGTSDRDLSYMYAEILKRYGWHRESLENEKPQRKIYLDAYYIDEMPVTNTDYKKFVDATGHRVPSGWDKNWRSFPPSQDLHPVVYVNWEDANAYAHWAGKRLPTEAEWEKAACGTDGRRYPWGNELPDANRCNFNVHEKGTTPVGGYGSRGDSPYHVKEMAGNVWEWCADWYDTNYYKNSPTRNPRGPDSESSRVLRGGSWLDDAYRVRATYRNALSGPGNADLYVGFRCVQ